MPSCKTLAFLMQGGVGCALGASLLLADHDFLRVLCMRWNSFHGLRGRLLLLVSLAMLPGVVLIAFGAWRAEHVAEQEARRALADSLAHMQHSFARELDRTGPDLQLAASKPLDQEEGCRAALRIVLAQDPSYSQVGVTTSAGQTLCTLTRPGAVPLTIEPSWAQGAMRKNGRVLALLPGMQGQKMPRLVVLRAVEQDSGGLRLAYVTYEASRLMPVLGLRAGATPGGARLMLVDSQGRAYRLSGEGAEAAAAVDLAGLQRQAGSSEPSLHRVGDELIALAPLGEHGEAGAVALVTRRSDLYRSAQTSLRVNVLILLVGFALLLLLLRWVTLRLVVAPAAALMHAADALGRGDLSARAGLGSGHDEFSRVARAFDRMAVEIQQRTAERARHLSQMERLNRLHEVLAAVNEAILRRTSTSRLMQDLCDIVCTTGGFSHVWIAEVNSSSDRLNVVSWAAAMPTRVWVDFSVSLDSSDPQSQGHAAEVVRTGKPAGSNRFRTDPRTQPWHERARELDIASSLVVPLGFTAHGGRRVLALHAGEEDYFAVREIQLIEQVAQDAVFGFSLIDTESKLAHSTSHDPITGLPTAQLLMHRMRELMQEARADRKRLIISVIDVGIQQISNQLGLRQSNLLLTEMGQELEARLGRDDAVGISPGGRFSLVMSDLGNLDEAANRLAAELAALQAMGAGPAAGTLHQKISAGVAVFPDDGDDADELFDKALAALDLAEREEDGGVRFYSAQTNRVLQENRQLLQLLHGALARSEMSLYYQPIISFKTGALHGFEALLRWHHPELGQIPPDRFIPLAESSGLIHELGDWVVRQVVAQATAWNPRTGNEIFISLNVSAVQLGDLDFAARFERMLEGNYSADQRVRIALEVTESHLIGDIERSVQLLRRLSGLGLSIVLDDFGTGYSSLSYLYRLPLNVLKIDRSFTADVVSKPLVRSIVQGIHALARSLDLETVVEGIEGPEQQQVLEQIGCNYGQGFFYDRALPADQAQRKWLGGLV